MTVFIGDFRAPATVGRTRARWSHLSADTREELHAFASDLGLRRDWLQDKGDGRWQALDDMQHRHLSGGYYRLTPRILGALRRAGLLVER